jgi:glutamine amidotransferase
MRRITLLDYGAGNLHSLAKALSDVGETRIEADVSRALDTDLLLLPGVGAFGQAARQIAGSRGELKAALADGLPCIGVCLGMQLLFDSSEEAEGEGIGILPGAVRRIKARRVPQMGWNRIEWIASRESLPRVAGSSLMDVGYFANAYVAKPQDESCVVAWTCHESDRFPSVVREGNTVGIQFHPEKSSLSGVRFLRAVAEELIRCR